MQPRLIRPPIWWVRYDSWLLGAALSLCLLAIGGYQVYQARWATHTTAKIAQSTKSISTCVEVDRLYSAIVKLMADDPRFTLAEVRALSLQRADRLHRQGCQP